MAVPSAWDTVPRNGHLPSFRSLYQCNSSSYNTLLIEQVLGTNHVNGQVGSGQEVTSYNLGET